MDIYRKYIKLRPTNAVSTHLFLNYRNGKCFQQVVGKGAIGKWPSKIATYLKLEEPNDYTGHAFRRTSATFLVNKGVDVLGLKRHGGWRSSTVAEGYVEDSLQNKIEFADKIVSTDGDVTFAWNVLRKTKVHLQTHRSLLLQVQMKNVYFLSETTAQIVRLM